MSDTQHSPLVKNLSGKPLQLRCGRFIRIVRPDTTETLPPTRVAWLAASRVSAVAVVWCSECNMGVSDHLAVVVPPIQRSGTIEFRFPHESSHEGGWQENWSEELFTHPANAHNWDLAARPGKSFIKYESLRIAQMMRDGWRLTRGRDFNLFLKPPSPWRRFLNWLRR